MLLILAGISLKLISGSNGILGRTTRAAKLTEIARFTDSKELSDGAVYTDMYDKETGYTNLYEYIKDKCEENNEATGDRLFEGDNGTYWIDDNNNMHFKDNATGMDGTVVKGPVGELLLKEVVTSDGTVNDVTTEETLRKEIESAIKDLKEDYEKNKEEGESFQDYIDKKIEEGGGSIKNPDTGGTIKPNGDGTYTYEDLTTPPNTGKITITKDENGKEDTIISDIKINKPDEEGGNSGDNQGKTEKDLLDELNKALEEQKDKQKEEGNNDSFKDYLDNKIEENGGKLPTPITGGSISKKDDETYTYEDNENPSNKVDFTIDENGNPVIKDTEINKPGGDNQGKTEKDLRDELEKAIEEQKKNQKEEGDTGSFKDYLDNKIDENGGKLPTPITGGSISKNEDGTFRYEDSEVPPNWIDFDIDENGNIIIKDIHINNPDGTGGNGGGTNKPNINLKEGDILFEYTPSRWTNQDVTVKAKPNIDVEGYTIQTSRNTIVWNNSDTQTFKQNGTIYVRLFNGKQYGAIATANVANIDKTKPVISEVSSTTNSIRIKATDEASGIVGYKATLTNEAPSIESFASCESTLNLDISPVGYTQGTTYYVWVRDDAGNISESMSTTTEKVAGLTNANTSIEYSTTTWTNQDVTVTAKSELAQNGFTIQTSQDGGKTWQDSETQVIAGNGYVLVRLVDSTGQYANGWATANVENIDKTKPVVGEVTTTTNSIHIKATDEASGIIGYAVTTSNQAPSEFTSCSNTKNLDVTVGQRIQGTTYYIWVKDEAGNISLSSSTQTGSITGAISIRPSTTSWTNGNITCTINGAQAGCRLQYMIGQNGTWTDIGNGGQTVAITANTTVYARLFDGTNAGTTASCGITNIDKTAPGGTSIRHNSGNGGCSWQNNINITLSASDNVGIAHYEIDWTGDGNANSTTGANFIPWNGFSSDNVRFRAVDHAGNRGAWSGSIHIHMDTQAPNVPGVHYNSGNGGCSWQNNINVSLSAGDNIGIAYYEIDWTGDGNSNGTTGANFIPGNGHNTCNQRYRAVDHAGNRSGWTGVTHMHMDTQAPWITNWWWGTATTSNVSLYIQVADNAAGVRNATVKVSTSTGGYGNWRDYGWVWDAGANAYRTDINPSDFQHWGCNYRAQLYMWDNAGNGGYINQSGDVGVPEKVKVCPSCNGAGNSGKGSFWCGKCGADAVEFGYWNDVFYKCEKCRKNGDN